MSSNESTMTKVKDQNQRAKETLRELGKQAGARVQEDAVTRQGRKFIIPERMEIKDAIRFLHDYIEQQEEYHVFERTFRYLPDDGRAALMRALKKTLGTTGFGVSIQTFFGKIPPSFETINVGVDETLQVPTGRVAVPILGSDAYLQTASARDEELGEVFKMMFYAPRKEELTVEGIFYAISEELKENSIYKAQAINSKDRPDFLDVENVDISKIVFSEGLEKDINALVWRFIEDRETLKEKGIPFKRAVTLYGDYGTGKTETMHGTAKKCLDNGVTFVECRAGKDSLDRAMQIARMYQPSVVAFEDIDIVADADQHQNTITRLLDLFDGMDAKHNDVMVLLTTNHVHKLHKGMLRPGRIDALIQLGLLDAEGVKKLSEIRLGDDAFLEDTDWEAIHEAMLGFQPAFVNEALKRVELYRQNGHKLTTKDFVTAAENLRPQWERMVGAHEGGQKPVIEGVIRDVVQDALDRAKILDQDGDEIGEYGMRVHPEKEDVLS